MRVGTKSLWIWLLAVLPVMMVSWSGYAGDERVDRDAYEQFCLSGDYEAAEDLIRRHLRRQHAWRDEDVAHLLAYQARIERIADERPEVALRTLQKAPKVARDAVPEWNLEMASTLRALGKTKQAEPYLAEAVKAEHVVIRTQALLERAYWLYAVEDWQKCMAACDRVGKQKSELTEDESALKALAAQARELREKAHEAWLLEKLGGDFAHYRNGRRAQARGQYRTAITHFRKIQGGILNDAGVCYTVQCLFALGEDREALKLAAAFQESEPLGLYRGEVRLTVARERMKHGGEKGMGQAYVELSELIKWQDSVRESTETYDLATLQPALKHFPPPAGYARKDDLGALVRIYAKPETIINRLTAPWYLPEQRMDAAFLMILAATEAGDKRAARDAVKRMDNLNAVNGGVFDVPEGVAEALLQGVEAGAFLVPPSIWNSLSREVRAPLRMACFLTVAGRDKQAVAIFEDVRKTFAKDIDEKDRAAIHFGLAVCAFNANDYKTALQELSVFQGDLKGSSMRDEALLVTANILAADPEQQEMADKLYFRLAKQQDRMTAANALLAHAIFAVNTGRNALAADRAEQAKRRYHDTPYGPPAANLHRRLVDNEGRALPGLPRPDRREARVESGAMHDIRKALVFPGGGDLSVSYSGIHAGDLLHYSVSASTAADCVILRSFSLRFTRYEPQLAAFKGHHGQFVRAPALYRSMLWTAEDPDPSRENDWDIAKWRRATWHAKVAQLIEAGRFDEAKKTLRNLLNSNDLDGREKALATAELALAMRETDEAEAALALIEALEPAEQAMPRVRLEHGRLLAALGRHKEARNRLEANLHDPDAAIKAESHLALAQLHQATDKPDLAAKHAKAALAHPDPQIQDVARALLGEAEQEYLVKRYGQNFFHYVQGRRAQLAGRPEDAISHYKEVKGGMLQDAARAYGVACLLAADQTRDAYSLAAMVLKSDQPNAYRAELQYTIAQYRLLHDQHDRAALKDCIEWLEDADAQLANPAPPTDESTPELARILADFPPPSSFRPPGDKSLQAPELLLNPQTAPWYAGQTRARVQLLLAFIAVELGDHDRARAYIDAAAESIASIGLDASRLRASLLAGINADTFLLPATLADKLGADYRGQLKTAAFLAAAGGDRQAEATLQAILDDPKLDDDERQFAALARAEISRRRGDTDAMRKAHAELPEKPDPAAADLTFLQQQLPVKEAGK